jgi:hypothetical protein
MFLALQVFGTGDDDGYNNNNNNNNNIFVLQNLNPHLRFPPIWDIIKFRVKKLSLRT